MIFITEKYNELTTDKNELSNKGAKRVRESKSKQKIKKKCKKEVKNVGLITLFI